MKPQTLYDAIRDHESHFQQVVYKAVELGLINLGEQIHNLDWANVSMSVPVTAVEAA
jgi:hypothetical protein